MDVYWDYEIDRRILEVEGWRDLAAKGFEPLRKALRLPRVNLFIADDTWLGKTIEAGLIAHT